MKIVIFLNHNEIGCIVNQKDLHAVIFTIEDEKVTSIEDEYFLNNNLNYLSLWCLSRNIDEIYTKEIDTTNRMIFLKWNIKIKTLNELGDDYLYKTFILGNKYTDS